MTEITDALSSPLWWITSGVMAFAMSLLAYYAGPQLDRLLALVSERARLRGERKRAERTAALEQLVTSEHRQTRLWLFTVYGELLTIKTFLISLLALGLLYFAGQHSQSAASSRGLTNVLLGLGTLSFLLMFWGHNKAFRNFELLREAWREEARREAAAANSPEA